MPVAYQSRAVTEPQREAVSRTADGGVDSRDHDDGIFPPLAPPQSLPCVRGGVSRSADGGVVSTSGIQFSSRLAASRTGLYLSVTPRRRQAITILTQKFFCTPSPEKSSPAGRGVPAVTLRRLHPAAGPPQKRKPPPYGRGFACLLWFGNYSLPSLVRQLRQTYLSS